ncbi:alpha/beta fold hydrolase [Conexibacter sp. CPCC 206217]|uniref:alpha/beta fold hydrolase n=1 Tax=Conexibacter sp. CPCC 206217 TaxID=3064574 RepID=UPI0027261DDB|nr:alpha/beta hydrolase [Conexibacter sp. CPCC 206217]MDO8209075.1 alpha/beta hydrolase [Conexibacter sp. CPCC 206217]
MTTTTLLLVAALLLGVVWSGWGDQDVAGADVHRSDTARSSPFRANVRITQVGDHRIAWYERGSGPPLLMAIGTGSTMAEWDPALLELLARERRLILFDYPGVGRSSRLRDGRTSFAGLADTAASLLEKIGLPRADVLGWSMGGFVAQQLAIRHPRAVRRLVLAGTNPGGDAAVLGPPADQRIDSDPNPSDAAALRVLYPRTRAGREEGRAFLRRLDRASDTGEIPDDFEVPDATVRAQVRAEDPWLRSNANAEALASVRAPALVTGGRQDPVVPSLNARRLGDLIPDARVRLLPGAHAFLFGDRERFAAVVEGFLGPA